ncbi:uncharacterized protein LOC118275413 isoform X1 [Spodoptera frugiperda]|uniref:Uncharacterized protein LOC118275413 isoform X1 n=2 Tax=Spodoptera frugiperda TaxID=7108 RepID=A0A9R0DRA2_SPOFR|nr:uncharacterized protein LOC118275413 isoform X1 [Spodoptera frugiperda]
MDNVKNRDDDRMADDDSELEFDIEPGNVGDECRRYLKERFRGQSMPPEAVRLLNQLNQSAQGSGVNATPQDGQASTAKGKKPAAEQKETKTPKKRKSLDPELLAMKNQLSEAQSKYRKCRIDLRGYEDQKTANRHKERIQNLYEQLQNEIKKYKDFAEKRKVDVDEYVLNLDQRINGTNEHNKQTSVDGECGHTDNEPQINVEKSNENVYNIIIKIPK